MPRSIRTMAFLTVDWVDRFESQRSRVNCNVANGGSVTSVKSDKTVMSQVVSVAIKIELINKFVYEYEF